MPDAFTVRTTIADIEALCRPGETEQEFHLRRQQDATDRLLRATRADC